MIEFKLYQMTYDRAQQTITMQSPKGMSKVGGGHPKGYERC